jgi:hypothetical protein
MTLLGLILPPESRSVLRKTRRMGQARIIHGQDDRRAECAIVTRSVSEANSFSRPRLRFALRLGRE